VGDQIADAGDGAIGDGVAIERGGDLGEGPLGEQGLNLSIQRFALAHPQDIGGEAGVFGEGRAAENLAGEDLPFALALDRDQHIAIGGGEDAIGRDGGVGEPQPRRLYAAIAPRQIRHVHQVAERVEQRELDRGALAGLRAAQQGLQNGGIGGLAGGDVGDRDADARRPRGLRAGDGGQTRFRLDQEVIGLAGVVRRARRVARDIAGDQPGIARAQFGRAEAEPAGGTRCEVLDEDIGLRQHGLDHGAVIRLLEIDAAGFLAAVEPDEIGGQAFRIVVIAAGEIAFSALQLDDARAGIGELAGRGRHGHRLLQRHHQNSFERIHRRSGEPLSHQPSQTGRRSRT